MGQTRDIARLTTEAEARCRTLHIEPPTPERVARIVRAAVRAHDDRRHAAVHARLAPDMRNRLDALLQATGSEGDGAAESEVASEGQMNAPLIHLRAGPGRASVASLRDELARLGAIRQLGLPGDLFTHWSQQELEAGRQRVAVEVPHELRRLPLRRQHRQSQRPLHTQRPPPGVGHLTQQGRNPTRVRSYGGKREGGTILLYLTDGASDVTAE